MKHSDERLIIFTRYPEPGKTKTRLIPLLGRQGAADLHRRMIERTLSMAGRLLFLRHLVLEIRYDGADERLMRATFDRGVERSRYSPQGGGDLGTRMGRAFLDALRSGAKSAVIVGTDIPDLTDRIVEGAFDALKNDAGPSAVTSDMVLGPARDGGYYLVGFRNTVSERDIGSIFTDIPWGTGGVLGKTLAAVEKTGLSYRLLEELTDVDRPEDLPVWQQSQKRERTDLSSRRISVIIPALNEEGTVGRAIESARVGGIDAEIIVVDGGSTDKTKSIAASLGVRVVESSPPRSRQANDGARAARGDVLLFMHADTRLPRHYERHIYDILGGPGAVAGAFRLGIDGKARSFRLVEYMANIRSRALQMPYGDQGLFVPRDLFYEIGGYPEIPIMDDYELIRRLRKRGTVGIAPVAAITSARRWQRLGVFRTTLINQIIIIAYVLGVSVEKIARWYRREKGTVS
jgi:hypothetical protein